ncbi:hypothetical protein Lesp01_52920 [Lentzea sp. NBRC 102530]|nr:hypothetical protein Lesp01_52920 [Lentzea sp. NBRC 102530]
MKKLLAVLTGLCLVAAVMTVFVLRPWDQQAFDPVLPPVSSEATESSPSPATVPPGSGRADFLYFTQTHLVLMRGEQVVTRLRRFFGRDAQRNKVVWTNSGDHVVLFSDADLRPDRKEQIELIAIDVSTGEERRYPCRRCTDVTAVGADSVLVNIGSEDSAVDGFHTIDLKSAARQEDLKFPPALGSANPRKFLASTRSHVITGQASSRGGSDVVLVEFGAVAGKKLDLTNGSPSLVVPYENGSGERYALVFGGSSACGERSSVQLMDAYGTAKNTDTSAMMPPGTGSGFQIEDLWWTARGELRATASSWTCTDLTANNQGKQVLRSAGDMWALENGKWVKRDTGPVTRVRELSDGATAVLTVPSCIGRASSEANCSYGTLAVLRNGQRTVVDEKALFLSAPPVSVPSPRPTASSIAVAAPPAAFTGTWSQHAGGLTIDPSGLVTMSYQSTATVMPTFPELTMRITGVTGAQATATVLTSTDTALPQGAVVTFEQKSPGLVMTGPGNLVLRWCDADNRAKGKCGA